MRRTFLFAAALLLLATSQLIAGEGFGFSKRVAKMNRRVLPEIHLTGNTIDVRLAEQGSTDQAAGELRKLVEARIVAYHERLKVDVSHPDIVIQVAFEDSDYQESWESRTDTEFKQTGTKQEWNAKKAKYETKPVFDHVAVNKNFKRVKGTLSASYEALDRSKRTIHQGDVLANFDRSYENGSNCPAPGEVERQLLEQAADAVTAQLVGSIEPVSVLLPRGSLDSFVPLAEQGSWDRYFTAVQSVSEMSRPTDEAYRQYALGLGSEGMAYSCGDQEKALAYLRTAESHYRRASQMKPEEKFFAEAIDRVTTKR